MTPLRTAILFNPTLGPAGPMIALCHVTTPESALVLDDSQFEVETIRVLCDVAQLADNANGALRLQATSVFELVSCHSLREPSAWPVGLAADVARVAPPLETVPSPAIANF